MCNFVPIRFLNLKNQRRKIRSAFSGFVIGTGSFSSELFCDTSIWCQMKIFTTFHLTNAFDNRTTDVRSLYRRNWNERYTKHFTYNARNERNLYYYAISRRSLWYTKSYGTKDHNYLNKAKHIIKYTRRIIKYLFLNVWINNKIVFIISLFGTERVKFLLKFCRRDIVNLLLKNWFVGNSMNYWKLFKC